MKISMNTKKSALFIALACALSANAANMAVRYDSTTLSGLGARNIGSAAMSGRVSAVAAYEEDGKTILYVGAASGGVWKSRDGGTSFEPIFDKQSAQSIGAITIDPNDKNTAYVGLGGYMGSLSAANSHGPGSHTMVRV